MGRAGKVSAFLVAALLASGIASATCAATIPACRSVEGDVRTVDQEVVSCLATGAECDEIDHLKRFYNMERILPPPGYGQGYREARVGHGPNGSAGPRRIVVLLDGPEGRGHVLGQYYTGNHYLNFCEITAEDAPRHRWFLHR